MRRMIEPKEVAAAILFLAFPAASAITGAIRPVDAGTPFGRTGIVSGKI